ncbi:MAG: Uma2 family endonuclease [Dehalococcoidia bacterium]
MTTRIRAGLHRFSVEEYERLSEIGLLDPDSRDELLEGMIYIMPAVRAPHAICVELLSDHFRLGLDRQQIRVRAHNPIRIMPRSEPEPDVVVARRPDDKRRYDHPEPPDILLVVEVADTSYQRDSTIKLAIYTRAGIPEYWIVNLPRRRIEVFRSPEGRSYRETRHVTVGDEVAPAAFPDLVIPVADLLPAEPQ